MKTVFVILIGLHLSACQYMAAAQVVTQQGNMITEKQVSSLKIGMSKTEAAIVLGSSLITPTFQKDRWDYVFTWQQGQGPITVKRLSLYFEKDRLVQLKTMPNH